MNDPYQDWMQTHVPTPETAYGACRAISVQMQAEFPELTPVYGNYYCPVWGTRWHQWLVTADGEIVDPTAHQFPSQGAGVYVARRQEELPCGVCANGGEEYYVRYDGTVCSEVCGKAFIRSIME